MTFKAEPHRDAKPIDKAYFEANLSPALTKAIHDYVQGEIDQVSYMDCLWGEIYGSINADFWAGCITEEQADYLRKKYLYGEEQEDAAEISEDSE